MTVWRWCSKCKRYHKTGAKITQKHKEYLSLKTLENLNEKRLGGKK